MLSSQPRAKRAALAALVLAAATGMMGVLVQSTGQAQENSGSPAQGHAPDAPLVEPDPETVIVPQGDDAVAGVGVKTSQVPALGTQGGLKRETRNADTIVAVQPKFSPGPSEKYGVAQVVTMRFPVSINRQKQVERAITVEGFRSGKGSRPVALPTGRWGWVDARTAVYRPKKFWPGDTTIKFTANLKGVVVSEQNGTRYEGSSHADLVHKMRTGRKFVLEIKNAKHQLRVIKRGKSVKTFGVSLGKRTYRTRSGIKVLSDTKYRKLRMVGTDRHTGETWDVISPYSMPLTTDGEYIHGAPWARYRIGSANGSHGCTNMNPKDARWLYNRVRAGDPVVTKGTGKSMTERLAYTDGKPWTYSWKKWKKKSYSFK